METMQIQTTPIPHMHVIPLGTCFDVHAEPALEWAVLQVQEAQGKHIILNLEALTRLDSRALGKLFLTYHHLNRKQIRLSMVNPSPAVREMLEFVNFPQIVPIYDSIEAVVASEHRQMESFRPLSGGSVMVEVAKEGTSSFSGNERLTLMRIDLGSLFNASAGKTRRPRLR